MKNIPLLKSKKAWLIAAGIALIIVPSAWAFIAMRSQEDSKKVEPTSSAVIELLAGSNIDQKKIDSLNKDDLFWAYFKQAALQQKLTITKEFYFTDTPEQKPTSITVNRTGFDYATKQLVQAEESYSPNYPGRDKRRCYDNKEFYLSTGSQNWYEAEESDRILCKFPQADTDINDGINTGGLTEAQADTFIHALRKKQGLVTISEAKVVSKNNSQYLQFTASLSPVQSGDYGYMGGQWLMWAFKETGLDPSVHPYGYTGAGGEGLSIQYTVDVNTKLPVYSEISTTNPKNKDGSNATATSYSKSRTLYEFGKLPDVSKENANDITANW